MNMEWIKTGISPLTDLIAFINKKSQTNDVVKKRLLMELRNNLNLFKNGFLNKTPYDKVIDLLSNDAIQEAIKSNFPFKKLKGGVILVKHIREERNKKYQGWTSEQLVDKIDEKIVELKNIKKLNGGSIKDVKNNIPLMMGNLYFRLKLLAEFIRSQK
jgi:hypothetical protein